jgi:hypothetical protein
VPSAPELTVERTKSIVRFLKPQHGRSAPNKPSLIKELKRLDFDGPKHLGSQAKTMSGNHQKPAQMDRRLAAKLYRFKGEKWLVLFDSHWAVLN